MYVGVYVCFLQTRFSKILIKKTFWPKKSAEPTQAAKNSKYLAKQSVEILKSSEKTKSWVQFLKKLSHILHYNTWLSYAFF